MRPLEEMGKFKTVVVDPPWPITPSWPDPNGVACYAVLPYETLDIPSIAALPLPAVLDTSCVCFVWTTQQYLPETFGIISEWELRYAYTMTWHKAGGPQPVGRPAYNSEFLVVGYKGQPRYLDTKAFRTANFWPRGAHSEKPEGFYDLLRRVTPGPRLDVFGRRRIAGFYSWGDEAPEGEPEPDHYQMVLANA